MNRDYEKELIDTESSKYGYNFDLDVMHPFMVSSMEPFFKGDRVLELGSYQGEFTKHLLNHFDYVTCLEASKEAIDVASKKLPNNVSFINGTFENITLVEKFKIIVMTHVLEHLDDPLELLKKIKSDWLAPGGLLLITVPNANAISRQIAVEMGIVESTTCVTESEFIHGHRATYNFESLAKLINQSGLKNVFQTGIFFKAFANFQWDQILEQKIVSPEFLEASFKIGRKYPDLCSSLFVVCENAE